MKRAVRRSHRERVKAKVLRVLPYCTPETAAYLADNRTPCSCWMCGNPRRYAKGRERITMQERILVLDERNWNAFVEMLENPPEPTEALKKLFRRQP
jgi:hypothetical protein